MATIDAKEITKTLRLKDKIRLLTGKNCWQTVDFPKLGIPSITFCDGPHGIRKVKNLNENSGETYKSTCFPSEALIACSFDKELLFEEGKRIAKEAKKYGVDVILGPGLNIKRNPLCGRNFEYYSEDPVLAGLLASNFVLGAREEGVETCLKHFAVNNQETKRMVVDCIVDTKTLHEIYFKAFEIANRLAKPRFLMASYNKINGTHVTDSKDILDEYLRKQFGYEGLVISDWGAVFNKIDSINAGLDIEMPYINRDINKLTKAAQKGKIDIQKIDESVFRIVEFAQTKNPSAEVSDSIFEENYSFAVKAAENSIVLAKNYKSILPLNAHDKVAFIGPFVNNERYQGEGSSRVEPFKYRSIKELASNYSQSIVFADGCSGSSSGISQTLIKAACKVAQSCNKVVLMLGTRAVEECEGFDRKSLALPRNQLLLLEEILKVNKNVIVNLYSGSVVEIPNLEKIKGLTISYLGGEGISEALLNVLYGRVNPSGKLCETWIKSLETHPTYEFYNSNDKFALYKDSIYVGYRYFEYADVEVNFPFGFGLSYTEFEYSKLSINKIPNSTSYLLKFDVKNVGKVKGKEVAQIYTRYLSDTAFVSPIDLANFEKVELEPGETKTIEIKINIKSFEQFSILKNRYMSHTGKYEIMVGSSVKDIKLRSSINLKADGVVSEKKPQSFVNLPKTHKFKISNEDFAKILKVENLKFTKEEGKKEIDADTLISEIKDTGIGKKIVKGLNKQIAIEQKRNSISALMMEKSMYDLPIRSILMGKIPERKLQGIIKLLNGHYIGGIKKMFIK